MATLQPPFFSANMLTLATKVCLMLKRLMYLHLSINLFVMYTELQTVKCLLLSLCTFWQHIFAYQPTFRLLTFRLLTSILKQLLARTMQNISCRKQFLAKFYSFQVDACDEKY